MDVTRQIEFQNRIAEFVKRLISLIRSLPNNSINKEYGTQIIRSGGSIGANYCEATEADSRIDFNRRIKICKRESKETNYWLDLLKFANKAFNDHEFDYLLGEAHAYVLIFSKIIQTTKNRYKIEK